jgi:hypothetical protein
METQHNMQQSNDGEHTMKNGNRVGRGKARNNSTPTHQPIMKTKKESMK